MKYLKAFANLFNEWRELDMKWKTITLVGLLSMICCVVLVSCTSVNQDMLGIMEKTNTNIIKGWKHAFDDNPKMQGILIDKGQEYYDELVFGLMGAAHAQKEAIEKFKE